MSRRFALDPSRIEFLRPLRLEDAETQILVDWLRYDVATVQRLTAKDVKKLNEEDRLGLAKSYLTRSSPTVNRNTGEYFWPRDKVSGGFDYSGRAKDAKFIQKMIADFILIDAQTEKRMRKNTAQTEPTTTTVQPGSSYSTQSRKDDPKLPTSSLQAVDESATTSAHASLALPFEASSVPRHSVDTHHPQSVAIESNAEEAEITHIATILEKRLGKRKAADYGDGSASYNPNTRPAKKKSSASLPLPKKKVRKSLPLTEAGSARRSPSLEMSTEASTSARLQPTSVESMPPPKQPTTHPSPVLTTEIIAVSPPVSDFGPFLPRAASSAEATKHDAQPQPQPHPHPQPQFARPTDLVRVGGRLYEVSTLAELAELYLEYIHQVRRSHLQVTRHLQDPEEEEEEQRSAILAKFCRDLYTDMETRARSMALDTESDQTITSFCLRH